MNEVLSHPLVVAVAAPTILAVLFGVCRYLRNIHRAVTNDLPDSIEQIGHDLRTHMAAEETQRSELMDLLRAVVGHENART